MIKGHGDDAYQYDGIRSDFSSNICANGSYQALMAHLAAHPELIGHYPEPEAWSLEAMIAESLDIDPECVIVTSGATDAIYLVAQTFRYKPVIPEPTFREYEDACLCFGETTDKTMLWLCNPNNPTGEVYDRPYIERMTAEHDVVVVDQSYETYTAEPVMLPREAVQYRNLILLHSMTKTYAVPGLRLGYITAHAGQTRVLRRFLRPWSVSAPIRPDLAEAQRLCRELNAINGISVLPTSTNFMLCRMEGTATAAELKDYLARRHGLLIRDASNFSTLTHCHFRVAAQTAEEDNALINAIRQFIAHD